MSIENKIKAIFTPKTMSKKLDTVCISPSAAEDAWIEFDSSSLYDSSITVEKQCTCDLHTVIMVTGYTCGGK